jgi:sugar lactone lactonase YvrE
VTLLAGDGHIGWRDGPTAEARFADPYGVALDPHGLIYVADAGAGDRIRVIHPDGGVQTLAGGQRGFADGAGAAARFDTPSSVALDAVGDLYIADTGNHAIRKMTPDGHVTTLAGTGQPGWRDGTGSVAQFNGPVGIAIDAAGRVLVADTYNDRIRAIAPDGNVTTLAGGDAPGDIDGAGPMARFDTPCGLAIDARGRIVVADTRNDALRAIDAAGNVSTIAQANPSETHALLHRPLSVAFNREGDTLVGMLYGVVALWPVAASTGGEPSTVFGTDDVRFVRASGLATGPNHRVLAVDAAAARLYELTPRADGAPEPLLAGALGPAPDRALPATAQRWPLRPQLAWHEVVGTMGEDRGDGKAESRDHFHDGLDVRGDIGQEVVAIADGTVTNPLAVGPFGKLNESLGIGELGYVHLRVGRTAQGKPIDLKQFQILRDASGKIARVRVRRGTHFAAGAVLGTINPMAHTHLWLGVGNYGRNPLQLGFAGYLDHVAPTIVSVEVRDVAGQRLTKRAEGRLLLPRTDLGLVVDAFDQVDLNLPRRRLGIYSLGYQWLSADGTPVAGFEQPRTSIEFATLPHDSLVKAAYAADSGITVLGSAETHFRYQIASAGQSGPLAVGPWSTSALVPGDYTLRIVAKDYSGNEAMRGRDLAVRVQ